MTHKQVMAELKKVGTAQNVKTYKRHGAGDVLFGVSFAELSKLTKKNKVDHELALSLWETGNTDARILAAMIADPAACKASLLDRWLGETQFYCLVDQIAALLVRTEFAGKKMQQWMKSKKEFFRQAGFSALACGLKEGTQISDASCKSYLKTIEQEIHQSANRGRHAMNTAVMAIGIFRPSLTKLALASARRIGKVAVDHGDTACKTPDAYSYIEKAVKRRKAS